MKDVNRIELTKPFIVNGEVLNLTIYQIYEGTYLDIDLLLENAELNYTEKEFINEIMEYETSETVDEAIALGYSLEGDNNFIFMKSFLNDCDGDHHNIRKYVDDVVGYIEDIEGIEEAIEAFVGLEGDYERIQEFFLETVKLSLNTMKVAEHEMSDIMIALTKANEEIKRLGGKQVRTNHG